MNEEYALACAPKESYDNRTCGDNLRTKIAATEVRLTQLKEALVAAEQSGLADMKISSIRDMMQY